MVALDKYGKETSIRCVIRNEVYEAEHVLRRHSMLKSGKQAIIDNLKEIAYHWCMTNAEACAEMAWLKEKHPEIMDEMQEEMEKSETYQKTYEDTMSKTYPFQDEITKVEY